MSEHKEDNGPVLWRGVVVHKGRSTGTVLKYYTKAYQNKATAKSMTTRKRNTIRPNNLVDWWIEEAVVWKRR